MADASGGGVVRFAADGLRAERDIAEGEAFLQVPEALAVTAFDARTHPTVGELAEGADELVALALWLMAERAAGDSSRWHSYISTFDSESGGVDSPLVWSEEERDDLLRGSPALAAARARLRAVEAEYEALASPLSAVSASFTREAFSTALVAVFSRAFYLPSAQCFALVPVLDAGRRGAPSPTGETGSLVWVDFDVGTAAVTAVAGAPIRAGAEVRLVDTLSRNSGEMLLACGYVDEDNAGDYLELEVGLVAADALYMAKKSILESVGLSAERQSFPIYEDRLPTQLLSYLRLSRVQDSGELLKVTFDRDALITDMNEYETLNLVMADLRDRMTGYSGTIDDDLRLLQPGSQASARERLAAQLRLREKRILQSTMTAVRKRLAPIRGIPTKSGVLEDPNADLLEIFDTIENGPKRIVDGFLGWARGDNEKKNRRL